MPSIVQVPVMIWGVTVGTLKIGEDGSLDITFHESVYTKKISQELKEVILEGFSSSVNLSASVNPARPRLR